MNTRHLFASTAAASLLLLAACGGGSSPAGSAPTVSPAAVPGPVSSIERAPQPADAALSFEDVGDLADRSTTSGTALEAVKVRLPVAVPTVPDSLAYSFDSSFTTLAPGWWINWWGSRFPSYSAHRATSAPGVYSGTAAQVYRLNSVAADGDANLVYSFGFVKDSAYTVSVMARADTPSRVRFQFRLDGFPYTEISSTTVDLTGTWQKVSLSGVYPFAAPGSLRVIPVTLGTDIYLDEMTITPTASVSTALPGGLDIPAQGASAVTTTVLKNYTMESAFTAYAEGFSSNYYGNTVYPTFDVSRETRADHVHGGVASQRFNIVDKKGGAIDLIAPYAFVAGKTYHASLWLKADAPTPVVTFMRMDAHPWQPFTNTASVTIGSTWQKVDLEGTYVADATGSLRVQLANPSGTVWIDDVTISEINRNDMAPVSTAPIPDTLFGMHVNKLGVHHKWPGLGSKIVRLWDSGTTWRDLNPARGTWALDRMDMYVNYVQQNDPQANIIYTMGMTPQWASATPSVSSLYGMGAGGAPADMNDWRVYVRTLATRYAGKIRYWELWNEPDYAPHYNGGWDNMVTMARIAHEELVAADPANKLVGPGFTVGQGMSGLDSFLLAGGGQYIDNVGFHWYYSTNPESIGLSMDNVRNTMKAYGIENKPLWNTEGAFTCNGATMDCNTAKPTAEDSRGVNARAMMIMVAKGVQNFNYYVWENTDPFGKLVESDYTTPTAAATALATARSWIKGASLVDSYRVSDKAYVFRLTRGSESFVILWSMQANTLVNLPASWNMTRVTNLSGVESTIGSTRQLTIGTEPVLLK